MKRKERKDMEIARRKGQSKVDLTEEKRQFCGDAISDTAFVLCCDRMFMMEDLRMMSQCHLKPRKLLYTCVSIVYKVRPCNEKLPFFRIFRERMFNPAIIFFLRCQVAAILILPPI